MFRACAIKRVIVAANQPRPQGSLLSCGLKSGPQARSNDIPVLNDSVNTNKLRPEPIRFVRLDSGHVQSDGKSVNRGLPELDLARGARGRDPRR